MFPTCVSHLAESRSQVRVQCQPVSCAAVSAFPGWSHEKACFCVLAAVSLSLPSPGLADRQWREIHTHTIGVDLWQNGMTYSSDEMAPRAQIFCRMRQIWMNNCDTPAPWIQGQYLLYGQSCYLPYWQRTWPTHEGIIQRSEVCIHGSFEVKRIIRSMLSGFYLGNVGIP